LQTPCMESVISGGKLFPFGWGNGFPPLRGLRHFSFREKRFGIFTAWPDLYFFRALWKLSNLPVFAVAGRYFPFPFRRLFYRPWLKCTTFLQIRPPFSFSGNSGRISLWANAFFLSLPAKPPFLIKAGFFLAGEDGLVCLTSPFFSSPFVGSSSLPTCQAGHPFGKVPET